MVKQFIEWYTSEMQDEVSTKDALVLNHWESWRQENNGTPEDFAEARADEWLDPITYGELVLINEYESWRTGG